MKNYKGKKILS